jgi:hypothetical protein
MRAPDKPMNRKEYEKALRALQVELCSLQDWVKEHGQRVVVVFEGRDAAGKGGRPSPIASAPACSAWWRCLRRPIATSPSFTCSATLSTFLQPAKS